MSILTAITVLCICTAEVEAGPQEDRLLKRFFFRKVHYLPTSRPVADDSESVLVSFYVNQCKTFELVSLRQFAFYFRPKDIASAESINISPKTCE